MILKLVRRNKQIECKMKKLSKYLMTEENLQTVDSPRTIALWFKRELLCILR